MRFDNVDDLLDNWARFMRYVKSEAHSGCGSAERLYRAPKDAQERYAQAFTEPNEEEAMIAEKIINGKMPTMTRAMLIGVYIKGNGRFYERCPALAWYLRRNYISIRQSELKQYYDNAKHQLWMYYKVAKNNKP